MARKDAGQTRKTPPIPPARGQTASALQRWARRRRDELGLTVRQVARRSAINAREVAAFEKGDCAFLERARKLARLYGVPFMLYAIWTGILQPGDLAEWDRWNNNHDSTKPHEPAHP